MYHLNKLSVFVILKSSECYNFGMEEIQLDDIIELKKQHPCGSKQWKVTRVGADIRLECLGCGRKVMLTRRDVNKRMKRILPKSGDIDGTV
jgi:hypothetical protein